MARKSLVTYIIDMCHNDFSFITPTIVYDGECPYCTRYVTLLRLRETLGGVVLVDARGGGPLVDAITRRGLDLNEGMVLVLDGAFYHGTDCVHRLALLSTPSGLFNRVNAWIFRSSIASRLLYPILRAGRNTVLWAYGRQKLPLSGE